MTAEPTGQRGMRTIPHLVAEIRALLSAFAKEDVGYALCGGLAANISSSSSRVGKNRCNWTC